MIGAIDFRCLDVRSSIHRVWIDRVQVLGQGLVRDGLRDRRDLWGAIDGAYGRRLQVQRICVRVSSDWASIGLVAGKRACGPVTIFTYRRVISTSKGFRVIPSFHSSRPGPFRVARWGSEETSSHFTHFICRL